LDRRLLDQLFQIRLALDQRQFSQVLAVEVEQIESDHDEPIGLAAQFVLQHGKVGGAVDRRHDDLTIDDGAAGVDQVRVGRDLAEAPGPVIAAAGKDLDGIVVDVELDAIAVELISWIQRSPDGTFSIDVASAGSMNPGKGAFAPIAAAFLR
jgi:hypothetical protein